MADGVKIESLEDLKVWVRQKDVRIGKTLSARSALRAFPAAMRAAEHGFGGISGEIFFLSCTRAVLLSAVSSVFVYTYDQQIKQAAGQALAALQIVAQAAGQSDATTMSDHPETSITSAAHFALEIARI